MSVYNINGEEIGASSGISPEVKNSLLDCFNHIALWEDENGSTYIAALESALYPDEYPKIIADFEQDSHVVYDIDTLDSLKPYLVVTYYENESSSGTVISASNYTLSGTLTAGISRIVVTYNSLIDAFNVVVTEFTQDIAFVSNGNFTNSDSYSPPIFIDMANTNRQSFGAINSPLPKFMKRISAQSGTLVEDSVYSAIRIPDGKTKVIVTCSTRHRCNIVYYNLSTYNNKPYYGIITQSGWQTASTRFEFNVGTYKYFVITFDSNDSTSSHYSLSFA